MSDIFLSYKSEDRPRAKKLAEELGRQGWSVFWDRTILTGWTWRRLIRKELDSARCMVILWSGASIDSKWVLEEADYAQRRSIPILPVLVETVVPPLGYASIQAADLSDWDGLRPTRALEVLISDIVREIGSPSSQAAEDAAATSEAEEKSAKIVAEEAKAKPKGKAKVSRHTVAKRSVRIKEPDVGTQAAHKARPLLERLIKHKERNGQPQPSRFNLVGGLSGAAFGLIQTIMIANFAEQGVSLLLALLVLLCWIVAGALTGSSAAQIIAPIAGFVVGGLAWTMVFDRYDTAPYEWSDFWWFMLGSAIGVAAASLMVWALSGRRT